MDTDDDDNAGIGFGIFGDAFVSDPSMNGEDEAVGLGESFDESIDADDADQCLVMGECDGCHAPARIASPWDEVAAAMAGREVHGIVLRDASVVWRIPHRCDINGTVVAQASAGGLRATYRSAYADVGPLSDDSEFRVSVLCHRCGNRLAMSEEWAVIRNALRGVGTPECHPVPMAQGRYALLLLGRHCGEVLRVPVDPAAVASAAIRVKAGLK